MKKLIVFLFASLLFSTGISISYYEPFVSIKDVITKKILEIHINNFNSNDDTVRSVLNTGASIGVIGCAIVGGFAALQIVSGKMIRVKLLHKNKEGAAKSKSFSFNFAPLILLCVADICFGVCTRVKKATETKYGSHEKVFKKSIEKSEWKSAGLTAKKFLESIFG